MEHTSDRLRVHPSLSANRQPTPSCNSNRVLHSNVNLSFPLLCMCFLGVNFIMKFSFCLPSLFSLEVESRRYTSVLHKLKVLFEWDRIEIGISAK